MQADHRIRENAVALDPSSVEVDGRDSRDRLAFVANFAKLILYYNQNNQVSGDWQPFFLKDPAILLASISKTEYSAYHAKFIALKLESLSPVAKLAANDIVQVNQLCQLLQSMFCKINRWFHFMQFDASSFSLHDFLKKKIEETLSGQLWTMVALQQRLSADNDGITPPDIDLYQRFEPVWKGRAGSMQDKACDQQVAELCRIYHTVFDVFMQVIDSAKQAFYLQESQPTRYPDTGLLIAFSRLMQAQQSLINQFGSKHLDFYYDRILHQRPRAAQPDAVYVCLTLTDKADSLSVPAGTGFPAGNYPDNSEILFTNEFPSEVNRAAISRVNTLYYDQSKARGLYLGEVKQADQVARNSLQEILSWDVFGNTDGSCIQQGFALASPMLLLQSGVRTITIELEFEGDVTPVDFATAARFYLSTEKSWFEAKATCSIAANVASLVITLSESDPAIVAFAVNPDGFGSVWPMLKVMLDASADLYNPPVLAGVSIGVHVEGFTRVAIANDTSPLPNTGSVQILGPVPELGQCFYVGSNECFAKPLETLTLQLNWDNLIADFSNYYAPYNQYLSGLNPGGVVEPPVFSNTAFTGQWKLLSQKNWADTASPPPWSSGTVSLFQQEASGLNAQESVFGFNFKGIYTPDPMLALSALLPVGQAKNGYVYFELGAPVYAFGHSLYAKLVSEISLKNAQLLIEMAKGTSVLSAIVKAMKALISFLLCVLKKLFSVVRQALSRLVAWILNVIKRIVSSIRNVFQKSGSQAKPVAVSQDTLDEKTAAPQLSGCIPQPTPTVLLDMPNLPYSPRQSVLQLDYEAQINTRVSDSAAAYPLQLYHYGAFKPYLAYDAGAPENSLGFANLVPVASPVAEKGLSLFPGVGGQGCMYLALSSVSAPCTISLYAQITTVENQPLPADEAVVYCYWTKTGWQRLTVVRDDTDRLSRSGIVKLEIPLSADIPTDGKLSYVVCPLMPGTDFWIAVTTGRNDVRVRMSYLNTQALKLSRVSLTSLPAGQTPQIEAGAINSTQTKIAQIAGIVQPFASFGGYPAEDKNGYESCSSFYRRVSARLNNKDRASSRNDFVSIAHEACADLYYAKNLANQAGLVVIGLVKAYSSAQLPNAYTPLLGSSDQDSILAHLQSRASAMANIRVMNLKHQTVTLGVSLVISTLANANALIQNMNQLLKVYLSPWIASDLQQASLTQGVGRAALIGFLTSQDNVIAVSALEISLTPLDGGAPVPVRDDPVRPASEDAILVSAMQHNISVVSAANVAPIRPGGRSA